MVSTGGAVEKKIRRRADVQEHDIDIAVVIDVTEGCSTTGFERYRFQARQGGNVFKCAILAVAE
jgi:hypothetical protein